jgi:inosine-uridine nucleoside N-ribohydrolase
LFRNRFAAAVAAFTLPATVAVAADVRSPVPVIIDTDFTAASPSDDALAVLLALQSREIELVGITTVMGNDTVERATSDLLRVLEIAGRPEVPVYPGARRPLVHQAGTWERAQYGRWTGWPARRARSRAFCATYSAPSSTRIRARA